MRTRKPPDWRYVTWPGTLCAVVCLLVASGRCQSTYPAASCSEANVQAAYATEQASAVDGDIITIPAGTCTWSSLWNPSPTNTLTFQGAGATTPASSCTFTPGTACSTTSGSDQTILVDGTSGTGMWIVNIAANKTLRITGVENCAFTGASGTCPAVSYSESGNGQWAFHCAGGNCNLRLDHNHFYTQAGKPITIYGWGPFGVADHNLVDLFAGDANWISFFNGEGWNNDNTSYGNGNGSWADYSYWGSSKAFFMENNVFPNDESVTGVYVNDCSNGGREVIRYNTFNSPTNGIQAHEGGSDNRGCRTTEVYGNTSTPTGGSSPGVLDGVRSGSAFVWGNVGSWQRVFTPSIDRTNSENSNFNPNNLGYCGQGDSGTTNYTLTALSGAVASAQTQPYGPFFTNWPDISTPNINIGGTSYSIVSIANSTTGTVSGLTGSGTGVAFYAPSTWDGNTTQYGYPCYDQPGRGHGDLITGNFVGQTRKDSVTNTITWPREAIDPNYVWNNTNNYSGGVCVSVGSTDTNDLVDNRDYYQQYGTGCETGSNCTAGSSCNITVGVNQATRAPVSSPTSGFDSCTANSASPTLYNSGAPGVGWWDTANSTLYVCTAANTWTSYYTPYTYPHPLAAGSTYTITVSSITGNGTVTSSDSVINCTTGTTGTCTDSTATGTITLTETPAGGYNFTSWSGGTCSGSASTCNVTGAATVTATFTANPSAGATISGATLTGVSIP
jgi:hypothetical protein